MDLFDVVRACFRRWYVVLPLLLVAGWYSYDVYSSAKPVYYANTVLGLAPPPFRLDQATPGQPVPRNALLDVGGATLVASLTAFGLQEPEVANRVVAAGGVGYVARPFPTPPPNPQLPLVFIEASSPDPAQVTRTLDAVTVQADPTLRTMQERAGVPPEQMVKPFIVSAPGTPKGSMPSRTRSTIAIFVAGAGLSVLFTVAVDVLLTRWKSRLLARGQAAAAAAGPDPVAPPSEVVQTNGDGVAPVAGGAAGAA